MPGTTGTHGAGTTCTPMASTVLGALEDCASGNVFSKALGAVGDYATDDRSSKALGAVAVALRDISRPQFCGREILAALRRLN
ncbi:hypothetical protein [Halorussus litoreus]|uniref:hypothetical protein n=1 Tax=Halorussus litoreus TaxID=1710536 RepID=UPI001300A9D9|nr:hypothetical protein [Halorussus litoreus]